MTALTTTAAATRLGLTPGRVRVLCQSGALAAVRHGRDWLIDAASVDAYASAPRRAGWPKGKPRKSPAA